MPVSVLVALAALAATLENADPEAVMMPLLLAWYADNAHRAARIWPAPELIERILSLLAETAPGQAAAA